MTARERRESEAKAEYLRLMTVNQAYKDALVGISYYSEDGEIMRSLVREEVGPRPQMKDFDNVAKDRKITYKRGLEIWSEVCRETGWTY